MVVGSDIRLPWSSWQLLIIIDRLTTMKRLQFIRARHLDNFIYDASLAFGYRPGPGFIGRFRAY